MALLNAALEARDVEDLQTWIQIGADKFDVQTEALLLLVGMEGITHARVQLFKHGLQPIADAMVAWMESRAPIWLRTEGLAAELRLRLIQRSNHWTAIALGMARTREAAATTATVPRPDPEVRADAVGHTPKELVADFLARVKTETGHLMKFADIWRVTDYDSPSQWNRWRNGIATTGVDVRFRRTLKLPPWDFVNQALRRRAKTLTNSD